MPEVDGCRNYMKQCYIIPALVNKAHLLSLSASEMTVLIGDLKVLGSNFVDSNRVVLTNSIGVLNNDFFVNLLDMSFKWDPP